MFFNSKKKAIGIAGGIIVVTLIVVFLLSLEKIAEFKEEIIKEVAKTLKTPERNVSDASNVIMRKVDNDFAGEKIQLEPDSIILEQTESYPIIQNKPRINLNDLELEMHDLINQQRKVHGLKDLEWDNKLAYIALLHSNDMVTKDYFLHITPEDLDPTDRANRLGYKCEKIVGNLVYAGLAENLFQNYLYSRVWYVDGIPTSYDWKSRQEIAQSTVDGWMDSLDHRKNILDETFDQEGIGVVIAEDDKVFITQNFC